MLAATFLVHVPNGFFIQNGGYEFTLVLFAGLAALAVSGAGSWSLDYLLAHRRRGFRNIPEKLRPSPPPRGAQVLEEQEEP
ncbi:MAG: DoxX family protein, partial [Candidatus Liptonbacteria bacterium]|nr:DoxX family protein [Candidatus Liptonbacteria bacterium]